MAGLRQCIELILGRFKNTFKLFGSRSRDNFRLFRQREKVLKTVSVGFFLLNCHTCLNGSCTEEMFQATSPSLQEFLPLNEVLVPAPIIGDIGPTYELPV
jgi:hypothetical protein